MITRINDANGPVWVRVARLIGPVIKGTVAFSTYHPNLPEPVYYHGAFDLTYNLEIPEASLYKVNLKVDSKPEICGVRVASINKTVYFLDLMIVWSEWAEPENDLMIDVRLVQGEGINLIPAYVINDNWNKQTALNDGMPLQGGILKFNSLAIQRPLNKTKIVLNNGKIIFQQLNLLEWGLLYPYTKATVPLIKQGKILKSLEFDELTPLTITSLEGNINGIEFIDRTTFHYLHIPEGGYLDARSPLTNTYI